jgi:hypothetical protein
METELDNPITSYQVHDGFMLNLGEASSRQSFKVIPGDIIKFDGVNVYYGGIKGAAPTLRGAIKEGWLTEVAVSAKKSVSSAPSRAPAKEGISLKKEAAPSRQATGKILLEEEDIAEKLLGDDVSTRIHSSVPTPVKNVGGPVAKSTSPSRMPTGKTATDVADLTQKLEPVAKKFHSSNPHTGVTSTDDIAKSPTRSGKSSSNNNGSVQSTPQQTSTRGRTVIREESYSVSAIRAKTGAASPEKAVALGRIASVEAARASSPQSSRAAQNEPVLRSRRPAVVVQEESVSSRRASQSSSASKTLLDGTDEKLGVVDPHEVQTVRQTNELQRTGRVSSTSTATASRPVVASATRERDGNGGRSTRNKAGDQAKDAGDQSPSAIYKGRRATPAINFNQIKDRGADEKALTPRPIRSQAEIVDLTSSSDINGGVVVAATRSVKASRESAGGIVTTTTVGGNSGIANPKATVSSANNDSIIMSKKATVIPMDNDIYDPDNFLELEESHVEKKNVSVIDPDSGDIEEEDYSNLNADILNDPELSAAIKGKPPEVPETVEVPDNYLSTVMVGGLPWAKGTINSRTKFINETRNLSILALIAKDTTLQPSVRKTVLARLELLTAGT